MTLDLRERLARVIDNAPEEWSADELADAILSELDKAGMEIVPREPSEVMWRAGEKAFDRDPDVHHETVLWNVWTAMISSHANKGESDG